jgi:hypothetical protein
MLKESGVATLEDEVIFLITSEREQAKVIVFV